MKCDKLQYERLGEANWAYPASTLVIRKQFVDEAVAELKDIAENACLECDDNQTAIDELEDENRKLKRALWLARASSAKNKVRFFGWSFDEYNTTLLINIDGHKYKMPKQSRMMTCHDWIEIFERVEERCRQKAKEYK